MNNGDPTVLLYCLYDSMVFVYQYVPSAACGRKDRLHSNVEVRDGAVSNCHSLAVQYWNWFVGQIFYRCCDCKLLLVTNGNVVYEMHRSGCLREFTITTEKLKKL